LTIIVQKTRRVGLALVLACVLLIVLSATVWAAWGPWLRLGLTGGLLALHTATPTRTPLSGVGFLHLEPILPIW
jgi:hypothetical protein